MIIAAKIALSFFAMLLIAMSFSIFQEGKKGADLAFWLGITIEVISHLL